MDERSPYVVGTRSFVRIDPTGSGAGRRRPAIEQPTGEMHAMPADGDVSVCHQHGLRRWPDRDWFGPQGLRGDIDRCPDCLARVPVN